MWENKPCITQPRNKRAAEGGEGAAKGRRGIFAAAFLAAASFAAGFVAASIPMANRNLPQPARLRGRTARRALANQYTTSLTPGVVSAQSASRATPSRYAPK